MLVVTVFENIKPRNKILGVLVGDSGRDGYLNKPSFFSLHGEKWNETNKFVFELMNNASYNKEINLFFLCCKSMQYVS